MLSLYEFGNHVPVAIFQAGTYHRATAETTGTKIVCVPACLQRQHAVSKDPTCRQSGVGLGSQPLESDDGVGCVGCVPCVRPVGHGNSRENTLESNLYCLLSCIF